MPSPVPNLREPKPSDPLWHTLTIDRTLLQLKTDPQTGLTEQQVIDRQQEFGANELVAAASREWWQILLDRFTNIMLVMLLVVAVVSGIFDFIEIQAGKTIGLPFKDTIAILSIVILNGILGYLQESRAEQALAALKRMSAPKARGYIIRIGLIFGVVTIGLMKWAFVGEASPIGESNPCCWLSWRS